MALKQNPSFHNPKGKGNTAEKNWLLQEMKDQEREEDAMKPQRSDSDTHWRQQLYIFGWD